MPVLYFLKNPRATIAVEGKIDQKLVKLLGNSIGPIVHAKAMADGKDIIIPANDINISYIKEVSMEEYLKAQEEIKKAREADEQAGNKRIVRPNMTIPGRKH